jgi:hypothetical protein
MPTVDRHATVSPMCPSADTSATRAHSPTRPVCPHCGEPVGTYEAVWRFAPEIGAELTSWLVLQGVVQPSDTLWHVGCAEAVGVEGG